MSLQLGGEIDEYALHVGNMSKGNYLNVLTDLDGTSFTARDHDNDDWYSSNCADYYRGGWWLTNCGFDLHRSWCEGAGCMSWGSKVVKKSQLLIRPMSASGGSAPVQPEVKPFLPPEPTDDEFYYNYGENFGEDGN